MISNGCNIQWLSQCCCCCFILLLLSTGDKHVLQLQTWQVYLWLSQNSNQDSRVHISVSITTLLQLTIASVSMYQNKTNHLYHSIFFNSSNFGWEVLFGVPHVTSLSLISMHLQIGEGAWPPHFERCISSNSSSVNSAIWLCNLCHDFDINGTRPNVLTLLPLPQTFRFLVHWYGT